MERIHIHIGEDALVAQEAVDFVTDERAGGVAVFVGTTRRFTDDRETVELHYEAYEPMAVSEMANLAAEAIGQWSLQKVFLAHRLGRVANGQASVVVAVSAPHRDEAFAACRALIDRLKTQVPIWKKEKYADGGEEWIAGKLPEIRSDRGT